MSNKEFSARTKNEKGTAADFSTSASVEASPMLSAALSVEEGNLLISEFLEDEINANQTEVYPKGSYGCGGCYSVENLRYHYSWDWLIPVVEEIEKLGYGMDITPHGINVIDYTTGNEEERIVFINDDNYPKIYQIYWTVVEFIKWYNNNAVSVGSRLQGIVARLPVTIQKFNSVTTVQNIFFTPCFSPMKCKAQGG